MSNGYFRPDLTTQHVAKSAINGFGNSVSRATIMGMRATKPGTYAHKAQMAARSPERHARLLAVAEARFAAEAERDERERIAREEADSVTNQDEIRNDPALPPIPPTRQQMEADREKIAAQVINILNLDHRH